MTGRRFLAAAAALFLCGLVWPVPAAWALTALIGVYLVKLNVAGFRAVRRRFR